MTLITLIALFALLPVSVLAVVGIAEHYSKRTPRPWSTALAVRLECAPGEPTSASRIPPHAPRTGYSAGSYGPGTLAATMEPSRPYQRGHYRLPLPVSYPVMYSDTATIGEGKVTNLTVFGCTIECVTALPIHGPISLRLFLPDQRESLPITMAEVRWLKGSKMGLEFSTVERAANLRLHGFVWDRMLERLRFVKEQVAPKLGLPSHDRGSDTGA